MQWLCRGRMGALIFGQLLALLSAEGGLGKIYTITLGDLVGIIFGCVLFVIVLAGGVYYYYRNRSARHYSDLRFGSGSSLGEPLLASSPGSAPSAVEMVSLLWRQTTQRSSASIQDPWQLNYKKLKFGVRIGSGAFGTVFDGTYGETKLKVAIKRILLSADADAYRSEIKAAHSEMKILWELRHPNILTFFGIAFVRERGEELMCFVTELCAGSLDIYIGSKRKHEIGIRKGMPELTDELILRIVKDVAAGLAFMREQHLIKPKRLTNVSCRFQIQGPSSTEISNRLTFF
jgi:hypothetical protein